MGERTMRWLLFGVMVLTVPAVYFLFVVAGFLPVVYVVWLTRLDPSLWLPNVIHVVIWGAIFYGIAWLAARGLVRLPQWARFSALALVIAGLVWVAMQPIYGVGHSQYAGVGVYRLFVKPAQQQPMAITPSAPRPVAAPAGAAQHQAAPSPR